MSGHWSLYNIQIVLRKIGVGAALGFFIPIVFFALFGACAMWFVAPFLFRVMIDPNASERKIKTQFTVWGVVTGALGLFVGLCIQIYLLQWFWGWKVFSTCSLAGAAFVLNKA